MLSGHRVLSRRLFQFWRSIRLERFERPFFSFCFVVVVLFFWGLGWGGVFFFLFRMSSSKPEMQRLDCEEDHSERTGRCME